MKSTTTQDDHPWLQLFLAMGAIAALTLGWLNSTASASLGDWLDRVQAAGQDRVVDVLDNNPLQRLVEAGTQAKSDAILRSTGDPEMAEITLEKWYESASTG